jgi:hypothetical protein
VAVDLRAELGTRLDARGLVTTLLAGLTGPTGTLAGAASPVGEVQLAGAGQVSVRANPSDITTALERVAHDVGGALANLPAAQEVIRPLTGALELVETIAAGDLTGDIRALLTRLSGELSGSRQAGFLDALERLGKMVGAAPELRGLFQIVTTGFRAAGVSLEPSQVMADALPAVVATARGLGALMQLESALAEGERLTEIMARQLEPDRVAPEIAALRTTFETASESVSAVAAAVGALSPAEIESAATTLLECAARLAAVETLLSQSMGFGEATLVHFDIGRLEAEVREAAAVLGRVDTERIARTIQALLDRIRPVLDLELPPPLGHSLEALLGLLEARVTDIAGAIASVDLDPLADPIRQGFDRLTGALGEVSAQLAHVTTAVRTALEQVRQVVARLPVDEVANSIRSVLAPVTEAMDAMRSLVAGIEVALAAVSQTVTTALQNAEEAIDTFTAEIDALLRAAADFVDGLHLDQVVGEVADKVHAFADELAKAQMQPYFDTAVDAIDTAADAIGAVPLGLLPESMKADLETAVAPVRAINVDQVKDEIEGLLAIREGRFELRAVLDDALREIQERYNALLAEVEQRDLRHLIAPIDAELAKIRQRVSRLAPQLTLQPLQDAVARVKESLAAFDLRAQLRPLDEAFARIPALLEEYSPDRLIQPLADRVAQARDTLVSALRLSEWDASLTALADEGKRVLEQLDPERLTPLIAEALREVSRLLTLAEQVSLAGPFGDLVATLLTGSGQRIHTWTFDAVSAWLTGESGRQTLGQHADAIARAVQSTRDAVHAVDIGALATDLGRDLEAMRSAIDRLPVGSDARLALQAALDRVQVASPLASLASNRTRYLELLDAASAQAAALQRTGLSQVDVTVAALQAAFAPTQMFHQLFTRVLAQIGVTDLSGGVAGVMRRVLSVVTAERLGEILTPILAALKGRIATLLDLVLAPIRQGIARLTVLVNAIDLAPLQRAVGEIVDEAREQVLALSPARLLAPVLDGFDALKADLAAFDPLGTAREVVEQLTATVNRVMEKLHAEALLAQPIRIYDEIFGALTALHLDTLLSPILAQLDGLAAQVDEGLDRTAEAVKRLQDALPAPGGGASASLAASVSVG